jgi:Arc/MetJ-type ribon-helix-helix transcriptional regulator
MFICYYLLVGVMKMTTTQPKDSKKTNLKRTTIFLAEEYHEALRRLAFERRTSMAELIREAVLEMLEDEKDIHDGLKAMADDEGTITWEEYQRERAKRESQSVSA